MISEDSAQQSGRLYLIPSLLGGEDQMLIPQSTKEIVYNLNEFIVENARSARRYLRQIGYTKNFDTEVIIHELDKHAKQQDCQRMMKGIWEGRNIGIISEAGNPCIADPGNELVAYAHANHIEVYPLVGPSSILLALISSGMNGQKFCFNGYLPIDNSERTKAIKMLERAAHTGITQIFMETPFRNQKLFDELISVCDQKTKLCIACDITLPEQFIKTANMEYWKMHIPELHKRLVIFILG